MIYENGKRCIMYLISKYNILSSLLEMEPDLYLSDHISGGKFAIRRSALDKVGGIGSKAVRGSDIELSEKLIAAGHIIGFNPRMIIYHNHFRGYTHLLKRCFNDGKSLAIELLDSNKIKFVALIIAMSNLILVPFQFVGSRYIFLADKNPIKVYLLFSGIRFAKAISKIYHVFIAMFKLRY